MTTINTKFSIGDKFYYPQWKQIEPAICKTCEGVKTYTLSDRIIRRCPSCYGSGTTPQTTSSPTQYEVAGVRIEINIIAEKMLEHYQSTVDPYNTEYDFRLDEMYLTEVECQVECDRRNKKEIK